MKLENLSLGKDHKVRLFLATAVSICILLYCFETRTVSRTLVKRIDGCFTRMLRMACNIGGSERQTNELYKHLIRASDKIAERRKRLAGHLARHDELLTHQLLLWEPSEHLATVP